MKHLHFLILLFAFSISKAQNTLDSPATSHKSQMQDADKYKVFTATEIPASYPKGEKKLFKYIESNINKKALLENGAPKGNYNIRIRFVVTRDGASYDFNAESKNGFGIEDETIKVLKTIQKWKPAKQNNRKVYAYYWLSMPLSL